MMQLEGREKDTRDGHMFWTHFVYCLAPVAITSLSLLHDSAQNDGFFAGAVRWSFFPDKNRYELQIR
jgi:hypothetical protein